MENRILSFLHKRKYELLLVALIQHLFTGIFMQNMTLYSKVVWPLNILILGIASIGVFIHKGYWKNFIKNIFLVSVIALPVGLLFLGKYPIYFQVLNIIYALFFAFIFLEVFRFLIKPSYINIDLISASACGYLLAIEISVFLLQFFFYQDLESFKGISTASNAETFMDLVYFSSITLTSIGFGDITPNSHITKLITSFFGIAGQFYAVVLVGILISKFSANQSLEKTKK